MNNQSSQKQVFRVNIFHQSLSISSSTSADDFYRIADKVDTLMSTIASRSGSADGTKVGVLAAMHLADRLHQLEQDLSAANERASIAGQDSAATKEAMHAAVAAAEGAATALRVELSRLRAQVDSLQDELNQARANVARTEHALEQERARVGRDAGRLHSLLEKALDDDATMQPMAAAAGASNPAPPASRTPPNSTTASVTPIRPSTHTLFPLDD